MTQWQTACAQGRILEPSIIREYDLRGVAGETLCGEDVYAIGRAFTSIAQQTLNRTARLVCGRDGRLSSPDLAEALRCGMVDAGAHVIDIGIGPTPMCYFSVFHCEADGGVMLTGSHNPGHHNGTKLMLGRAPFFGEQIRELAQMAARAEWMSGKGAIERCDVRGAYVEALLQAFNGASIKTAWDSGNGAAGEVTAMLIERGGFDAVLLNGKIDGHFPNHHPDPSVPENLSQLAQAVIAGGCAVGLAFDGDADRLGAVDDKGRPISPDHLLMLLARGVLAHRPGAMAIADVKTSQMFFDDVAAHGGEPLMWMTGHSHIKKKLKETGAAFAGEASGHIFFADRYYGFDDGIYAALRLMELVASLDKPLSALIDQLPSMHTTPELRIDVPEARKFAVVEEVRARLDAAGEAYLAIDGVRMQTTDGWWLIRASNTQAAIIARAESASVEGLARLVRILNDQLTAAGVASHVLGA